MPKISQLDPASTPLSGRETFVINQNGTTYNASLSDILEYVDIFDSDVSGLSANWENTYTTVQSNSATWENAYTAFSSSSGNFAKVDVNNNFSESQTIQGTLTATQVSLSGTDIAFRRRNNSTSIGITNTTGFSDSDVVVIGYNAGDSARNIDYTNIIGSGAGRYAGFQGYGQYSNIIGVEAGYEAGVSVFGDVGYSNMIGYRAGYGAAGAYVQFEDFYTPQTSYSNMIGYNAGNYAGYYGNASYSNMIGYRAGSSAGYYGDNEYSNMIGYNAGNIAGYYGNASYSNMIGYMAGGSAGYEGSARNLVAVGSYAGVNAGNASGSVVDESIYVGLSAGMNQAGKQNIFIGSDTNTTTPSNPALSGTIAIGYGAKPSAANTIALGSTSVPLSVIPGVTLSASVSGLKIMINGTYFTIPML